MLRDQRQAFSVHVIVLLLAKGGQHHHGEPCDHRRGAGAWPLRDDAAADNGPAGTAAAPAARGRSRMRSYTHSVARASARAHATSSAGPGRLAVLWRTLVKELFDPYRPELHYMRGPGPKWRDRHAARGPRR